MNVVDEIISKYKIAKEDTDKLWLLRQLEDFNLAKVVDFYLSVVTNEQEDEEARIEVLRIFKLWEFSDVGAKAQVGEALIKVLALSKEDGVLNYTAMALSNFILVPGVLDCLERIVESDGYDEDLRYNALDSIEANVEIESCVNSLNRLVKSSSLGNQIRERLDGGY